MCRLLSAECEIACICHRTTDRTLLSIRSSISPIRVPVPRKINVACSYYSRPPEIIDIHAIPSKNVGSIEFIITCCVGLEVGICHRLLGFIFSQACGENVRPFLADAACSGARRVATLLNVCYHVRQCTLLGKWWGDIHSSPRLWEHGRFHEALPAPQPGQAWTVLNQSQPCRRSGIRQHGQHVTLLFFRVDLYQFSRKTFRLCFVEFQVCCSKCQSVCVKGMPWWRWRRRRW